MKVALPAAAPTLLSAVESWGWEVTGSAPDAILTEVGGRLEIRVGDSAQPDDVVFLPPSREEVEFRIAAAKGRRAGLAKRLHDLRSPLNAIQGYAEMLVEIADGDARRFASNICTASEILTRRLEAFREEGV